jgi:hypothetical protein
MLNDEILKNQLKKKKPKKDVYQFELTLQTHDLGYEFRITL